MTQEQSRVVGRAMMAVAVVQTLFYFVTATRRSYLAVAIPVGLVVAAISGIIFWIGYTMATTDWDEPEDYLPGDA